MPADTPPRLLTAAGRAICVSPRQKPSDHLTHPGQLAPVDDVAWTIRRVHDGEVVIPAAPFPHIVSRLRRAERRIDEDSTPPQCKVLGHLACGLSPMGTAAAMSISMDTARNHTQPVIEKLGVHAKPDIVIIAMREGLECST